MLEMGDILEKLQKLTNLNAHVEKELISFYTENEKLIQLRSELDSLKMIMNAQGESFIQLLSDSTRTMEMEEKRPAHFHNDRDSVRSLSLRREEHRLRFQELVYIMPTVEEDENEDEDDDDAHVQDQLNSVRAIEMEEERPAHTHNDRDSVKNLALRREEQCLRFHQLVVIMPKIMEEGEDDEDDDDEDDAHFQDQPNSVRAIEMEEERHSHTHNDRDSVRNLGLRREEQRLRYHQLVDIMPTIEEDDYEDEDENDDDAHLQDQLNSARAIEMEEERPSDSHNDRDSVRNLALRTEEQRLRFQQLVDIMPTIEDENENEDDDDAHLQDQLKSVRAIEVQDKRPAHCLNEGDSVRIMEEEGDRHVHFLNERNSVRNLKVRADQHSLRSQQTEEIVCHQASMKSPVEMGRRRKNCIVASKPTVEKEKAVSTNEMRVGLAPPTNLKARTAKVSSQSSPCRRPGRNNVKIYNKKMDYSKIKAKVDTWRKGPTTE
jgi:hypothetical protein